MCIINGPLSFNGRGPPWCIVWAACGRDTLKKKFVSCPADGQNHGHSGGRNFFSFLFFWRERKLLNSFPPPPPPKKKIENWEKKLPSQHKKCQPAAKPETVFVKGGLTPLGAGFYTKSGWLHHVGHGQCDGAWLYTGAV